MSVVRSNLFIFHGPDFKPQLKWHLVTQGSDTYRCDPSYEKEEHNFLKMPTLRMILAVGSSKDQDIRTPDYPSSASDAFHICVLILDFQLQASDNIFCFSLPNIICF